MVSKLLAVTGLAIALVFGAGQPGQAQQRGKAAPSSKSAKATSANPVNLNTATAADLQTLPNVGAATAARILEYRQKNGGFKKIEDLMNVKGIGEKSFLKLKPLVIVAAPKTAER